MAVGLGAELMQILYGVQGTGNGHITRARTMARALTDSSIEVDYLFSSAYIEFYQIFSEYGAGATFLCKVRSGSIATF